MSVVRPGLWISIVVILAGCVPASGQLTPPSAPEPTLLAVAATPMPLEIPVEENPPVLALATPLRFEFPGGGANPVLAWRPPPYPVPWSLRPEDHFFFARPIPSGEVNWPNGRYRYGSTFFGEEKTHTGVDLGAARDTDVQAAGAGEVVWFGYGLYRGVPDPTDPYGLSIVIRHDFGYDGNLLYTVYAHLSSVSISIGQPVAVGDVIGKVGDTGHASGPHLHFEVRLGANDFFSTLNPELWMVSPEGWGVLAGRITDSVGRSLKEQKVQVQNLDTGQEWEVWTYALGAVRPDAAFQENFVLGDLPGGPYEVRIDFLGRPVVASLLVHPGQTNFIVFRGQSGFLIEPTPTPPPGRFPPWS